jgi:hypothetical protein
VTSAVKSPMEIVASPPVKSSKFAVCDSKASVESVGSMDVTVPNSMDTACAVDRAEQSHESTRVRERGMLR